MREKDVGGMDTVGLVLSDLPSYLVIWLYPSGYVYLGWVGCRVSFFCE